MSKDVHIMIQGNNHRLIIDKDVVLQKAAAKFLLERIVCSRKISML